MIDIFIVSPIGPLVRSAEEHITDSAQRVALCALVAQHQLWVNPSQHNVCRLGLIPYRYCAQAAAAVRRQSESAQILTAADAKKAQWELW